MTGLPTIAVYLDDGTETYPYNITSYVSTKNTILIKRGRADEFGEADASSVDLVLKNNDGRFSLGSVAYNCQPGQGVKYVETKGTGTFTLYGYVDAWPTAWDGPLGKTSWAKISVIDAQSILNRTAARSMIESEVRRAFDTAPAPYAAGQAYYPLTEPLGSVTAADVSGNGHVSMVQTNNTGDPVDFGTTDGPLWFTDFENSAPTFYGGTLPNGGRFLTAFNETFVVNSIALSAFISTTDASCTLLSIHTSNGFVSLSILSTGELEFDYGDEGVTLDSPLPVNDGEIHHIGVCRVGTTISLYVDGVAVASAAAPTAITYVDTVKVGGATIFGLFNFSGMISHVVIGNDGLGAFMDDIYAAGMTGFEGDTAAQRVTRLAGYGGLTASSTASTPMAGQQLAGSALWSLLQQVEDAEGGRLYVDQNGAVALASRLEGWANGIAAAVVTIPLSAIDHGDLVVEGDRQFLFNQVSATREGGAQQSYDNRVSMAAYGNGDPARGVFPKDLGTLIVTTDDEVRDRCSWIANVYGTVRPRMSSITIDLLTASTALVQAVLALEVGAHMQITGLPSQSPLATADLIVEGWNETQTSSSWKRTFNTSAAVYQQPWTLQDATYGAYDSNPLAY